MPRVTISSSRNSARNSRRSWLRSDYSVGREKDRASMTMLLMRGLPLPVEAVEGRGSHGGGVSIISLLPLPSNLNRLHICCFLPEAPTSRHSLGGKQPNRSGFLVVEVCSAGYRHQPRSWRYPVE